MRRAACLVLVALVAAGSGALPAAHAAAPTGGGGVVPPSEPVLHSGRWLVDARGRVVVIHGVNMPTKWGSTYPAAVAFGDDDAELLASAGFNAVRLTVERYAVEPAPGRFDDAYVAHFADTMAMLARHGILSLIDFHQDEYGPVFHDNGFPAWMTMTDGLPNLYQVGFPFQYLANPALNRAYDHFWANDVGPSGRRLQDDDARILNRVAGALAHAPGLLGFEVINEPWPGTQYPTCYVPGVGCPVFDRGAYSEYNGRAIAALRAADPQHLLWYEPVVSFNYGIPTSMQTPRDPRLGFSFHDYPLCGSAADQGIPVPRSAPCGPDDELVLSNAAARTASTGDALLLTEFGATRDVTTLEDHLQEFDAHMIPWMFWAYDSYLVAYAANGSTLAPATGTNVNQGMVAVLARPYPQLVAGTPAGWQYDPTTKKFAFRYTPRRADRHGTFAPGAETDIAVPAAAYPHGYQAHVSGGTVISGPNAPILRIHARRGTVAVRIVPG